MNISRVARATAMVCGLVLVQDALAARGSIASVTKYVLTFSGPESAWEIIRGSARLVPKNGLPLVSGDCIVQRGTPNGGGTVWQLTLISDGREVVVDRDRPRHCIAEQQPRNPVAMAIARTFASLAGVFHSAEQSYDEHSAVPMTTRGSKAPPVIPVLGGHRQYIASGKRELALSWASGSPPYTVVLTRAGQAQPFARLATELTHARMKPVTYIPGTYHITVSDAAHAAVTVAFVAVPAAAMPPASADVLTVLEDPETPADVRAAFDAARLMADPSGAWRFEAYQRVVDHGRASALAERLIYDLESGG